MNTWNQYGGNGIFLCTDVNLDSIWMNSFTRIAKKAKKIHM